MTDIIKQKHILVVDDDQVEVARIKKIFAEIEDVGIDVAYNGKEAMDKLQGGVRYDLVILEILVPKLNGVDVCKEMYARPELRKIPVLLISVLPMRSKEFRKSLQRNSFFRVVADVLGKPFTDEEMLAKVKEILIL